MTVSDVKDRSGLLMNLKFILVLAKNNNLNSSILVLFFSCSSHIFILVF